MIWNCVSASDSLKYLFSFWFIGVIFLTKKNSSASQAGEIAKVHTQEVQKPTIRFCTSLNQDDRPATTKMFSAH